MKAKIVTTFVIAVILAVTLSGVKHIDNLNDSIKFKHIELKDNTLQLELLDQKYIELNKQLEQKDSDKVKIEEDLKKLQEERNELEKQLQAKKEQKERDLAVRAQRAVTGTQVASAATSVSGSCTDWMQQAGIPITEATRTLILKESSCRPTAQNPTTSAYGIGQFLDSTWATVGCVKTSDPVQQLVCMQRYVVQRYASWDNALATWYSRCGSDLGCWY